MPVICCLCHCSFLRKSYLFSEDNATGVHCRCIRSKRRPLYRTSGKGDRNTRRCLVVLRHCTPKPNQWRTRCLSPSPPIHDALRLQIESCMNASDQTRKRFTSADWIVYVTLHLLQVVCCRFVQVCVNVYVHDIRAFATNWRQGHSRRPNQRRVECEGSDNVPVAGRDIHQPSREREVMFWSMVRRAHGVKRTVSQ